MHEVAYPSGKTTAMVFMATICLIVTTVTGVESKVVSIDEAIRMAQMADIDYKIAELTWENAQIDDMTARALDQLTPYELLQQDLAFRQAQRTFEEAHTGLVIGVIEDYIGLLRAEQELEISHLQLEVAEIQLDRLNEMIRIGNATERDRLRELNNVATARLNAATRQRTYESLHRRFLRRLDLPEDEPIVLDDRLPTEPVDLTLDEVLAAAREASFDVWERSINMELAALDLESVKSQNPAPLTLKKAQNHFEIQTLNASKSETEFVAETTARFHQITDTWSQLENAEREFIVAQETFEQVQRQFKSGLKTELDMKQAEIDRLVAQQTVEDARNEYALIHIQFDLMLGIPPAYGRRADE